VRSPRFHSGELEGLRPLPRDGREAEIRVEHDVADLVDAFRDPLVRQVPDGGLGRREEEARHTVDQDAVQLLRHRAVKGAEPGLHMGDRDAELRRSERAGESGVRVPVDEHEVGLLRDDRGLDPGQHARRLLRVAPGARLQAMLGRLEAELVEENLRELAVVVLARVQEDLVRPVSQRKREGSGLYELRTVADDRKDSHADRESS
jgi:hypothetical protein